MPTSSISGEELVGRVTGEDVRGARLDPDPDEREQALLLPGRGALELVVAELDADLLVRVRRVRLGERHRHVEVRDAGLEARVEDRDVEERVDGVQDGVGARLADERDDGVLARRVDRMRAEAAVVERRRRRSPDARRRSPRARSARRTSGAWRSGRRPSPHRLFRRRESARRRRVLPERSGCGVPPTAIRSAEIPGSEVVVSVSVTQQKQFIGGEFVDSASGETMEVLNPATGEVIAEVPRGTAEDVERAVDAATKAWGEWQDKTPKDRMELLLRLADVIDENAEELARLESLNVGKPWWVAVDEPGVMSDCLRFFAGAARNLEGKAAGGVRRGLHLDDPPRAARHRRGHLPLELPALHGDLEDRARARRRERPDHQARRADAAHDAPLRRARAGGHPARRPAGGHGRRDSRRRRARAAPGHPPRLAHGRHGDREDHRQERGGDRQARAPRARRQGADGRARRRRPGHGRRGDQDRRLLQLRPGLHGVVAHPRQREDLRRRALGDREGGRVADRRRPDDGRRDRHGAGHLGRAAGARPRLPRARDSMRRRRSSRAASRSATAASS